jgi:biotin carboxyl carrier protein
MEKNIEAVMPGLCARVVVEVGEKVKNGQEVAVINCMKNEISVVSDVDGVISEVISKEWDELQVGDAMVKIETED